MGREVAELARGVYRSGTHHVEFTPMGLATGVYFCRLVFGGQTLTQAMLYVK